MRRLRATHRAQACQGRAEADSEDDSEEGEDGGSGASHGQRARHEDKEREQEQERYGDDDGRAALMIETRRQAHLLMRAGNKREHGERPFTLGNTGECVMYRCSHDSR